MPRQEASSRSVPRPMRRWRSRSVYDGTEWSTLHDSSLELCQEKFIDWGYAVCIGALGWHMDSSQPREVSPIRGRNLASSSGAGRKGAQVNSRKVPGPLVRPAADAAS